MITIHTVPPCALWCVFLCLSASFCVFLCPPASFCVYLCLSASFCVFLRLSASFFVFLCLSVSSSLWGPNFIVSAIFWNTVSLYSPFNVEEYYEYINQMGLRVQHQRVDLPTVPVTLGIRTLTKFTIATEWFAMVSSKTRWWRLYEPKFLFIVPSPKRRFSISCVWFVAGKQISRERRTNVRSTIWGLPCRISTVV